MYVLLYSNTMSIPPLCSTLLSPTSHQIHKWRKDETSQKFMLCFTRSFSFDSWKMCTARMNELGRRESDCLANLLLGNNVCIMHHRLGETYVTFYLVYLLKNTARLRNWSLPAFPTLHGLHMVQEDWSGVHSITLSSK